MDLTDKIGSLLARKGREVWAVSPQASVYEAIEMMADKQVGALLVIADERMVGVISERDYARKVILKGKSSKQTQVRDIMTSTVIFVTPDATIEECMRIVSYQRIRHLPVVEGQKVVGVVSIGDLVKR
ncbi:MAG: CBS domain-containing protein, partial [Acidobacteria bacterium]|nr:CBS domain-containing protein [Acidobacteriota bacterium]